MQALTHWANGSPPGEQLRQTASWFWADGRQQLSALSLALMALLLALSANIGVGAMVESFRTTFTAWLDKRLAAEIYVSPNEPGTGGGNHCHGCGVKKARRRASRRCLPSRRAETQA